MDVALYIGLTITVSRTEYVINRNKKVYEPEEIEINWERDENVEMFQYLGSFLGNRHKWGWDRYKSKN